MSTHPLREYREEKGISQEELADKLGVSRQAVGLIETGERRVTADNAVEWEKRIGIPREKLRPDLFGKAVA